ncbi:MAG: hypothetical protein Ta2B_05920 [Termitinemataceae bacterium]|nr:MAG: hypothetical protein Ta2B_05920 [Termitinemataceae bacterium]
MDICLVMVEKFITKIHINKVRHLENLTIELSETERKHLILIGKNGCGKTSVIKAIDDFFVNNHEDVNVSLTSSILETFFGCFSVRYEPEFDLPSDVDKIIPSSSKDFLKYMVWLDYLQIYAERNGEMEEVHRIKSWFNNLLKILREIYNCEVLTIRYNAKELRHFIEMPNREPFGLNEMADGYSAILTIVMDLIIKIENFYDGDYNTNGIVVIDEIEKHLHVELQKKVLPFLTTLFPSIQFIVTTHSPFVIESFKGAVVYNLERKDRCVISEARTANETVRDILGVPFTIPEWAEQKLNAITEKYLLQNTESISFEKMKTELEDSGLSSFFPDSMATVLKTNK